MADVTVDHRGFPIYLALIDTRGCRVVVKRSSSVGPACWVFCTNDAGTYSDRAKDADISPHLTAAQARAVALALLRFAEEADEETSR